ncbi:hypothetical protein HER10_EVM0003890 [Colletotrichum scovillei]|uniref:WD repeat protein n=1 Tax=Colletotrichum scovillei TaxID=1209932 RepID=A0A9P7R978_9PEZI|nr:uncharacterized protein HER10_EVM0003890 [Colletotrichum scovillei]KAF4782876.1 hypothetical protein HER10_EVM0003890 [Colletotrichum scovillei]KAG7051608.1 WD repeat protein [Colletotrichum scovillei]KAG7070644.1 WD repeat protein [Colletotrichum scovillei]KAG7078885.1 WD repeat protein [Colletotrichum scovillei]
MPTYKTSQEWLEQSSLLLQARPTTTRITTKYSIKAVKPRKIKTSEDASAASAAAPAEDATMTDAKPPRGSLVIKTFDPVSGVALKYRTTKAAEVSRLITCLGALGRTMSTSKPATLDAAAATKDEPMADAGGEDTPAGAATPVEKPQAAAGGGKKKKKGKK